MESTGWDADERMGTPVFKLGTTVVTEDGRKFKVNGIGGNHDDFLHCSFKFIGYSEAAS